MSSLSIFVLGCGTMGVAIISGVLQSMEDPFPKRSSASGTSTPIGNGLGEGEGEPLLGRFIATVGRPESVKRLRKTFASLPNGIGEKVEVWSAEGNAKAAAECDVILVCCKPNLVAGLLSEIPSEALENKLVVSICAGVKIEQMKAILPASTMVVRAMPNTPSRFIFSSIGLCRTLEEKHFDACTALSGSGPAFACVVLEAMADGGVMMGLPRKEALELAAQTMQGAARMVLTTGLHPAQLKDNVTTPGGCTIAGLLTLEDGKVRSTMARAIQVATQHAGGLGQDKK
ncbi:pyrroline-5-carboxylate reductase [Phaffia rhodozyma]|uniref:Pyrroline-5-carboxylate reductase n=1 Tax=Phaffia rhodozyma TaxID=264483 RepID=A0A0F7STQ9_PHARH|nr:pyrroline-5-carboxylate reductase [Phaffia rhodozyma]